MNPYAGFLPPTSGASSFLRPTFPLPPLNSLWILRLFKTFFEKTSQLRSEAEAYRKPPVLWGPHPPGPVHQNHPHASLKCAVS